MHPYSQTIEPTATQAGEFTDGDPQLNRARTILRSYWPNMIQRELLAILQAAGIPPAQEDYQQVKQAIQALINAGDASVLQSANNYANQGDNQVKAYANTLDSAQRTYIDQAIAAALNQANAHTDKSFIGQITAGPYASIPAGWLALEGGSFWYESYYALYQYIANYYGFGGGAGGFTYSNGTIYLPDMRGLFVRGYGGNSAGMGVIQGDAIRNITGNFTVGARYASDSGSVAAYGSGAFTTEAQGTGGVTGKIDNDKGLTTGQRVSFSAATTVPTSHENRPVNVAWRYIIRAY